MNHGHYPGCFKQLGEFWFKHPERMLISLDVYAWFGIERNTTEESKQNCERHGWIYDISWKQPHPQCQSMKSLCELLWCWKISASIH